MIVRILIAALFLSAAAACAPPASEAASEPVALVTTTTVTTGDLPDVVSGFGVVEFDPTGQRTINAEIEARVLELNALPGDLVEAGAIVLRLAPSTAAGIDMTRTRRDANAAIAAAERAKRLRVDGLASDADVEAAVNMARDLSEQATSLETRAGAVQALTAPVSGVIDAIFVEPDDLVAAGTMMARLASPGTIQARIGIEIEDAVRLKSGDHVSLRALDQSENEVATTIRIIDSRIDPSTRMAAALVNIPSGSGFLSGEAVRADMIAETKFGVLIIPRKSVFTDETGSYVYVTDGKSAQLTRVEIGLTSGNQTEIRSGLAAGSTIIVEGAAILSDGMMIRTNAAEPVTKQ